MRFNEERHIYLYGRYGDLGLEKSKNKDGGKDLIIYWGLEGQETKISSLEGIFVTNKSLADESDGEGSINSEWKLLFNEDKKKYFEEKYQGKFISFEGD